MSAAGRVAAGYEAVARVFAELIPPEGPGAALAVTVDGEPVVDLWGGMATQTGEPWAEDTACVVFSGTKGMVATAMLTLVERGLLDLDAPVAAVWPEFAAAGKERVLVGDVLAHTAGLPGIQQRLGLEAVFDLPHLADLLAAQAPIVPPGQPTYHALTYGWLCDAIARRVDGRPVARIVGEDVAGPLGLELWIGVPDEVLPRVAELRRAPDFQLAALIGNEQPDPRLDLVYGNPPILREDWNQPRVLQAEIPGGNGVATARAMARLYGCLAGGGTLDGTRLLDRATIELGRQQRSSGPDALSGRPLRFGAGFELAGTPSELGPAPDAFGHTGSGGSSHGAWPALRTGFSFVISELRPEPTDQRAPRLLAALHDAVLAAQ